MGSSSLVHRVTLLAFAIALTGISANIAWPQVLELSTQNSRVAELIAENKFQEALPLAAKAAQMDGDLVEPHATALLNLARINEALNHFDEAEMLFWQALAIQVVALGEANHGVADTRNWLALFYRARGRYADSEALLKHALSAYASAPDRDFRDELFTIDILTGLYRKYLGRLGDAERLSVRALAIRTKEFGPGDLETEKNRATLALIYRDEGRYSDAEPLLKDALAAYEKARAPDDKAVVEILNYLAGLYRSLQGRYAEAEPLLVRAAAILSNAAPDDPETAESLSNLALLYRDQRRYVEAEPLLQRALAIKEKRLGAKSPKLVTTLDVLAGLYSLQTRHEEATPYLLRTLAIREDAFGSESAETAESMINLGSNYAARGMTVEAEQLLRRGLAIRERALGGDHLGVAESLDALAGFLRKSGHRTEAVPLLLRSIYIREKALGTDHPTTAESYYGVASLYWDLQNEAQALEYFEKSINVLRRRHEIEMRSQNIVARRSSIAGISRYRDRFVDYTRAAYALTAKDASKATEIRAKAYEAAQWALITDTAGALSQMSARFGSGNDELGRLVREHQDLTNAWWVHDEKLASVLSRPTAERGDADKSIRAKLNEIERRLAEIAHELQEKFPKYQTLADPAPLSLGDAQDLLNPNEVLLQVVFTSNEGFVWALTKHQVRWVRIGLDAAAVAREVAALRCGLDRDRNWTWVASEGHWQAQNPECRTLAPDGLNDAAPLPFDLVRAHALYKSLFGEVGDLIKDKHLLMVPSGALDALPFQVLVTAQPTEALPATEVGYAKAKWLGTRNALTVLPAAASLKALRAEAKASRAADAYIGFGNPLLTGAAGTDKRAWEHQRCSQVAPRTRARIAQAGRAPALAPLLKGGFANVDALRRQEPLPESAEELCTVARDLRVADPDKAVNLGARATETRVKALSTSGALARARVIHFATHGLVAGETALFAENRAEPALLLTPPERPSREDDGLLTASDVATLKLDANWVILSACNTASSDTIGGDALSGLARAFFYAGARALLVSHWYVNSEATVALITKSFDALKADPKIGRANALRRAMATLIAAGGRTAHPSAWAPFVVVGEGGAGR